MSASIPLKVSAPEYFALERQSEIRYEYVDGEMIALDGDTFDENHITGNFLVGFARVFRARDCDCHAYAISIRVQAAPMRYRYPDVVALCGEHLTDGEDPPALRNPAVLVEVLSQSLKFFHSPRNKRFRRKTLRIYRNAQRDRLRDCCLR